MRSAGAFRRASVAGCTAAAVLLAVILVPPATAQERLDLDRLLEAVSSVSGVSARFTERKRIALLAAPLVSEGELYFAPPDRMLRRVTSPTPSAVLLRGDSLVMHSGDRREEIDLGSQPVVAGFVDSFRQVLRGDRAALERTYRVALEGDASAWRLTLRPRAGALRRFLSSLEIRGSGHAIASMRMTERSGDVTETELHDVRTDRRWTPAEIRTIFRLP